MYREHASSSSLLHHAHTHKPHALSPSAARNRCSTSSARRSRSSRSDSSARCAATAVRLRARPSQLRISSSSLAGESQGAEERMDGQAHSLALDVLLQRGDRVVLAVRVRLALGGVVGRVGRAVLLRDGLGLRAGGEREGRQLSLGSARGSCGAKSGGGQGRGEEDARARSGRARQRLCPGGGRRGEPWSGRGRRRPRCCSVDRAGRGRCEESESQLVRASWLFEQDEGQHGVPCGHSCAPGARGGRATDLWWNLALSSSRRCSSWGGSCASPRDAVELSRPDMGCASWLGCGGRRETS